MDDPRGIDGARSPVVSVLVPDPEDVPAGAGTGTAGAAVGVALTSALPSADRRVLVAQGGADPHALRCAVAASDVLVVAIPAAFPGWRRSAGRLLDAAGPLTGRVVFGVVTGGWPNSAQRAPAWLEAELRRRGACCLAPTLHLTADGAAGLAAITAYCTHWRPLVPSLVGLARREPVPAAG
ncbi:hypothetical protein PSU4_12070 [Pseudonocardia sulfidoxydans NBRC 16205]|uniref:NADPH-dependent FMN reductase-like domain-containing protein n=1 Tax=Pseudonocardia sulfidoxydans NBRC 16205 TaxID=1223511 RepID=A0A511DD08_9PSEU|nr:hypothetical protein [Pseudonocardia sulfidoxydans]GEL22253.1 hypothetical protein PSU4_12070 [Pseudonocardia sulfidoxydans NBRC 16205]